MFLACPKILSKYLMEERKMKAKDLEVFIGHKGRVSEILNKKRKLTLEMARNLFKGMGIPAEIMPA